MFPIYVLERFILNNMNNTFPVWRLNIVLSEQNNDVIIKLIYFYLITFKYPVVWYSIYNTSFYKRT